MKKLITIALLLVCFLGSAQVTFDQIRHSDRTILKKTVIDYDYLEDEETMIFTFTVDGIKGLVLYSTILDVDSARNAYVSCIDSGGKEVLLFFNIDYTYCSITLTKGNQMIEFINSEEIASPSRI